MININGTTRMPSVVLDVFGVHNTISYLGLLTTSPFFQETDFLLVTPGEEYTPYEKLLLPFDKETWILLIVTFLLAFCTICIINKLSTVVQNLFYGEHVRTPTLNLISIFFGISQTRLPDANFPRQILILFVYFCLIFRTCYQSKIFEFMTSNPRRSPPETIEDLTDRNYTIYMIKTKDMFISFWVEIIKWLKIEEISFDKFIHIYETQSQNASGKFSFYMNDLFLQRTSFKYRKDFGWLKLKHFVFFVHHGGIVMPRYAFYYEMITKTVNKLIDTGIMKYFVEAQIGYSRKYHNAENEPKVLNIDDLAFGFNIWLGFCFISIFIFFLEIILKKIRILWRKSKNRIKFAKIDVEKQCTLENENLKIRPEVRNIFRIKVTNHTNSHEGVEIDENSDNLEMIIDEILNIEC